jgi:hypothetical protein
MVSSPLLPHDVPTIMPERNVEGKSGANSRGAPPQAIVIHFGCGQPEPLLDPIGFATASPLAS